MLTKRRNVQREILRNWGGTRGFARQDFDAARYLVLHRISVRKEMLHQQQDISTTGRVITKGDRRL